MKSAESKSIKPRQYKAPKVQTGLFDYHERERALLAISTMLDRLNEVIPFESFREQLETKLAYKNNGKGGQPPFDPVFMLKVCVVQYFYGLSDAETEFQIKDRSSFQRFLGLGPVDAIPDTNTLWTFKERLGDDGVRALFDHLNKLLEERGLVGKHGKIIDATIVEAQKPKLRAGEYDQIKAGKLPESRQQSPVQASHTDMDARWVKKNGQNYYGYKNHAKADLQTKLLEDYKVTAASVHDSQAMADLVSEADGRIFADSAYVGGPIEKLLCELSVESLIHEKGYKDKPLGEEEKQLNKGKSRFRVRIEHIFAWHQQHRADQVRTIGLKRASWTIGFGNLVYNLQRWSFLELTPQATAW